MTELVREVLIERAPSMLPSLVGVAFVVAAARASSASTRPFVNVNFPRRQLKSWLTKPPKRPGSTEFRILFLRSTVESGEMAWDSMSAATPATCGAAIEVPSRAR